MSRSLSNFVSLLFNLLPPGAAFSRAPGTTIDKLLTGQAEELARANSRIESLTAEANPATTVQLLSEWEETCGLPDKCNGQLEPTIQGRQNAIVGKLTAKGGQSKQYFIDVAAKLGFTITITELVTPNVWQINSAETVHITYFRSGRSHAGEPLRSGGNTLLECKMNQIKPAHTQLYFVYGD
jgi:uncharacterized protein YmfQ (DUF2313 family)